MGSTETKCNYYTPVDDITDLEGPCWFRVSGGNPHLTYEVKAGSHQEAIDKALKKAEENGLDFGFNIISVQHETELQLFVESRHGYLGDVVRVIPCSSDPFPSDEAA